MKRGPLYQQEYKPQFSGHETFPLRHGWLKKAVDAVIKSPESSKDKSIFLNDDAISRFGVGKNMVASMRHWAIVTRIIEENKQRNRIDLTPLGRKLFDADGLDPYIENPATLWLLQWRLCGYPDKTTWFWTFNYLPSVTFDEEYVVKGLIALIQERNWQSSPATLKRDVQCFIRTYVARIPSGKLSHEEALESPFIELGLIRSTGKKDGFRFVRGAKSSLGDGVFAYSLIDFWSRFSKDSTTLSFEAIAHEPGSPGRVFLLDENSLADRLYKIEDFTDGKITWSETAGMKQLIRTMKQPVEPAESLEWILRDYPEHKTRKTA